MKSCLASTLLVIVCTNGMAAQPNPQHASTPPSAAAPDMKPGLWEITNVIETAGSPSKRTMTMRICYAAEDVKSALRVIPPQREFGMRCDASNVKSSAASISWRVACAGKQSSMNGQGKMLLASDSYSATASLTSKAGAKIRKVEQTISGKWISECK